MALAARSAVRAVSSARGARLSSTLPSATSVSPSCSVSVPLHDPALAQTHAQPAVLPLPVPTWRAAPSMTSVLQHPVMNLCHAAPPFDSYEYDAPPARPLSDFLHDLDLDVDVERPRTGTGIGVEMERRFRIPLASKYRCTTVSMYSA